MRTLPTLLLASLLALAVTAKATATEIPRDKYLKFVPLEDPQLVQQTAESESLHLFGDPRDAGYRDVDPIDGIDDRRHDVLMSLAVRFAPYLAQNTTNIPVNFDTYIEDAAFFPLYVDTWNVSGEHARLVQTEGINFSVLGEAGCSDAHPSRTDSTHLRASRDDALEDCKLVRLLNEYAPWAPQMAGLKQPFVKQRPSLFNVLFFDFPGEGPGSWEEAYEPQYDKTPVDRRKYFPHAYVHPFLKTAQDKEGTPSGYDLVLQYWFYYPSNDGGNNHEGDWEHLNVVIAPLSMVEQPLSKDTLERILSGATPASDDAPDPLVIQRIEYYFHHFVMTLDFSDPNVYCSRSDWKANIKRRPSQLVQEKEIWEATRYLAYVDDRESVINTHPLGYIGADNKGLDQALTSPGGKNRNSHGTFPFPGRYHNIGPAGATEQVSVYVDIREYWKELRKGKVTDGPVFKRGQVLGLANPDRLRIVPDWERIAEQVLESPRARRDWSWLVLPIHWGYPATESPFSGILPHADTGNLAPVGPSFSSGWNVSGPAPGFHKYEPHTLPSVFPLGLQDSFRNDLGYFNIGSVLFNLPPLDFLTRIGTYPLKLAFSRRDPVYFPEESVPFRFFALSSGVSYQKLDERYGGMALNPAQYDEFILNLLKHFIDSGFDSTTSVTQTSQSIDDWTGSFFEVSFYVGKRFTSENLVRNMRPTFHLDAEFNNIPPYHYSADLDYWEYAGSLRYSLTQSRFEPFVKAGYGWSWYRFENVQANGVLFTPPQSGWVKPTRIWPNVGHVGLGVEYLPWKRVGRFPGGMELTMRFEYDLYLESLGVNLSSIPLSKLSIAFPTLGDIPGNEILHRHDFLFAIGLSF